MANRIVYALPPLCLLLSACVSDPTGPGVTAVAGTGKTPAQFAADDTRCRQIAAGQVHAQTGTLPPFGMPGVGVGASGGFGGSGGAVVGGGVGVGTRIPVGHMDLHNEQAYYDSLYAGCMIGLGHRLYEAGDLSYLPAAPAASAPTPTSPAAPLKPAGAP
jgi:hypothetical protein